MSYLHRANCIYQFLFVFFGVCAAMVSHAANDASNHYVREGQTLLLELSDITRVSVGSGDIASVNVIENNQAVLITGMKKGVTDLRVWREGLSPELHIILVSPSVEGPTASEIRSLIKEMEGVKVTKVQNSYVLDGKTKTDADASRAEKIATTFPSIISLVEPPDFEHKQTVLLHARFLEVNRNALKQIGINWADAINGPVFSFLSDYTSNNVFRGVGLPSGATGNLSLDVGGNSYFGLSTSVSSVINLLDNNGDARLLAEPTLSSISGGSAKFLAGGDLPIPVVNSDGGTSVEFRQYGIALELSPVVDKSGFIQSTIKVEVSSIDNSVTVLGVPGLLRRSAETQMNVYDGQTMVIAGLFSQEDSKIVDKVPGLGDLPILGEFFKSREFRNKETELVVLVTPRIIRGDDQTVKTSQAFYNQIKVDSEKSTHFDILD